MHEEELLQKPKLRYRNVGRASSLQTLSFHEKALISQYNLTDLDSRNSDTDMSSLDHADIIRAVSNGEEYSLLIFLH